MSKAGLLCSSLLACGRNKPLVLTYGYVRTRNCGFFCSRQTTMMSQRLFLPVVVCRSKKQTMVPGSVRCNAKPKHHDLFLPCTIREEQSGHDLLLHHKPWLIAYCDMQLPPVCCGNDSCGQCGITVPMYIYVSIPLSMPLQVAVSSHVSVD